MQSGEAKHSGAKPFIVRAEQFSSDLDKKEEAIRFAVKSLSEKTPVDEKLKAQIIQIYEAVSNFKKVLVSQVLPIRKKVLEQKRLYDAIYADLVALDQKDLQNLVLQVGTFITNRQPDISDLKAVTRDVATKIGTDFKTIDQQTTQRLAALELGVTSGLLELQSGEIQKLTATAKNLATKKETKEEVASISDLQLEIKELESECKKIQSENKQILADIKRHETTINSIRKEVATWDPSNIITVQMRDQKEIHVKKNLGKEIDDGISKLNYKISEAREYLIKTKLLTAEYLQLLATLSSQSQPVKQCVELLKSLTKAIEPKTKASVTTQTTAVVKSATVKTVGTAYSLMQSTVSLLTGSATPAKEVKQEEKKQEKPKQPKDMTTEELWRALSASLVGLQKLINADFLTPIQQTEVERDRLEIYFSTESLGMLSQLRRDLVDEKKGFNFKQISDEQKDFVEYSHPGYSSARQIFSTKEAEIIESIRAEAVTQSHLERERTAALQRIDAATKERIAELKAQQTKLHQALEGLDKQIKQLPLSLFTRRDRTQSDREDAMAAAILVTSRKPSAEKKDKEKKLKQEKEGEVKLPEEPKQISDTISLFRTKSQSKFTKGNFQEVLKAYAGLYAFKAANLELKSEYDTQIFAGLMLDHNLLRVFLHKIYQLPGQYFNAVISTMGNIKTSADIDHLKTQSQVVSLFRKLINDLEHKKVKDFDKHMKTLSQKVEASPIKAKKG